MPESNWPLSLGSNRIAIGNDGSHGARKALHMAINLAKRYDAELHQVIVNEPLPRHVEETRGFVGFGRILSSELEATTHACHVSEQATSVASTRGIKLTSHVINGDAANEITRIVKKERFGLLVIGFNGHSAMFGSRWGSTSQVLVQLAACSVLVVK